MNSLINITPASPAIPVAVKFTIPIEDTREFATLPSARRGEVQADLILLKRAHDIRLQGRGNWVADTNALAVTFGANKRGCSGSSIRRKYDAFMAASGDWRVLVKGYTCKQRQPAEFVEYLRALTEKNPRSVSAAIKNFLYVIWPSGAHIPGYGTWQDWYAREFPTLPMPKLCPKRFPAGWGGHGRNLSRYAASRVERKLFGVGYKAAHDDMPSLMRDTSRLLPMQMITIDDFELDVMCVFRGDKARGLAPQVAYVGGLMAIDVATRKRLAWVIGPMLVREEKQPDGSIKQIRSHLTKLDVQALLYLVFSTHGIPDHKISILAENATASISGDMEQLLHTMSGGRITVDRTSMIHHKTLANGFSERSGAPWQKGWIESAIGNMHNLMADLPGYKGSNERLNGPGHLEAAKRYALRMLGQGADKLQLPDSVREQVETTFRTVEELQTAMITVHELIERFPGHKMIGFEEVTEFMWPDPALPAPAGIDPIQPNNFYALGHLTPQQQMQMIPKIRMETIQERWTRLSAEDPRSQLPVEVLNLFMLQPVRAVYRNRSVSFTHAGVGYTYVDERSVLAGLLDKAQVMIHVDFDRPQHVLVTDSTGKALGILTLLGGGKGVDITDNAAVLAARKLRSAWLDTTVSTIQSRPLHQEADAAQAAMLARNEERIAPYVDRKTADAAAQLTVEQAAAEQAADRQRSIQKSLAKANGLDATKIF